MARPPLRDDAIVVRFGLMRVPDLHAATVRCLATRGYYGLSFFGENGVTLDRIAFEAQLPHRWLFTSTCGVLRAQGHTLRREGSRNHLVLRFFSEPTPSDLEGLSGAFDGPIPNPHPFR